MQLHILGFGCVRLPFLCYVVVNYTSYIFNRASTVYNVNFRLQFGFALMYSLKRIA